MDVLDGGIKVPGIVYCPSLIQKGFETDMLIHATDWYPTLLDCSGLENPGTEALDGISFKDLLVTGEMLLKEENYWQFNRYLPIEKSNACVRDGKWKLYWPHRNGANQKDPKDNLYYKRGMKEPHFLMTLEDSSFDREIGPILDPKLFDLENDPGEKVDLSESHPDLVKSMIVKWEKWWDDILKDYNSALPGTDRIS